MNLLLLGCSEQPTIRENPEKHYINKTAQQDVPHQKKTIDQWNIVMTSKSDTSGLPMYVFELTFEGNTKAENVQVEAGNGTMEIPVIEKNQGITLGSTYSLNDKQVSVTVSWKEAKQQHKETVEFTIK